MASPEMLRPHRPGRTPLSVILAVCKRQARAASLPRDLTNQFGLRGAGAAQRPLRRDPTFSVDKRELRRRAH